MDVLLAQRLRVRALQNPLELLSGKGEHSDGGVSDIAGFDGQIDSAPEQWQVRVEESGAVLQGGVARGWSLGGGLRVKEEGTRVEEPCAVAGLYPLMSSLGWHFLAVSSTGSDCSDLAQAFSAGYLEGKLTWKQMWQHYQNEFGGVEVSGRLKEYLAVNMEYLEEEVEKYGEGVGLEGVDEEETSFWWQVGLILVQLKGLEAGYRSVAPLECSLPSLAFQILSLHGDIQDLEHILSLAAPGQGPAVNSLLDQEMQQQQQQEKGEEETQLRRSMRAKASVAFGSRSGRRSAQLATQSSEFPASSWRGRGAPPAYPESCSAIVKVLPQSQDLVWSQATWGRLETMLRVHKTYNFTFSRSRNDSRPIPGQTVVFSGYPGRLFSGDDFYLTSAGLAVQETTIGNFNEELYREFVKPRGSVLEWMRNVAANRLASSGREWASIFSRHNSGTYNNQWMVVDSKRFTPGELLKPGTLWVVEQIPGHVVAKDMTRVLGEQTYWASYNIPAFPEIFNLSGYAELEQEFGDFFSYHRNARARMFQREHVKVVDIPSLQRLMRYNDYKHDPLSACNCTPPYSAELAIAARGDLNLANGTYELPYFRLRDHAETDAKIGSFKLLEPGNMESFAISGPTWDQQPPFRWSTSPFANISHLGHPDLFLFPWLSISVAR